MYFTVQEDALCLVPFHNLEDNKESYLGVWDMRSGKELCRLKPFTSVFNFSSDGQLIISCIDNIILMWDSRTGKEMMSFQGQFDTVKSVAISADKRQILTGHTDHSIRLWRISS